MMQSVKNFYFADVKRYDLVKRIMDVTLSLTAIVMLAPILVCISLIIKRTSPGPVFFLQKRVGYRGEIFCMYKFRTMCSGAEKLQQDLECHNKRKGPVFKMDNDPRITTVGAFLRKHSLDELPQLFNILLGHMSIVGPRPPMPREVSKYDGWHHSRFEVRPGLTCFWQVACDRDMSFDNWVELDIRYIQERSLWLDVKLIAQTIPVVLLGQH